MTDSISCKFIFTDTSGYCLIVSELDDNGSRDEKNGNMIYKIPQLDIGIDYINRAILKNTNHKFFYAIKGSDNLYHLKPIKEQDVSAFKEKTHKKQSYEEPIKLAEGQYGKVYSYPTENIIIKKNKFGDVKMDFVKEIAVYRLFKEFDCLPHFYKFMFLPVPSIMLEKGITTITNLKMTFDIS